MSEIFCFSVYDLKAEIYMTPYFTAQPVFGSRAFERMCKDKDMDISQFLNEFELRFIGTFDTSSGKFNMEDIIRTVSEGRQFQTKIQFNNDGRIIE